MLSGDAENKLLVGGQHVVNKALPLLMRLQEQVLRREDAVVRRAASPGVLRLRARIPQELLCRFDRLTQRGRPAVAPVSESGVCGACHLLLPAGDVWMLCEMSELLVTCPHCGCYLYFEPKSEKFAKSRAGAARYLRSVESARPAAAARRERAAQLYANA
jgi:hypothetical protein